MADPIQSPYTMPGQGASNLFYTGNSAGQGNNQSAGTGSQANQYNPGQLGLQSQLPSLYSNFLNGQAPTSFTAPQAMIDQYNQNFKNYVQPNLVMQYGAGSPQIAAQQNRGLIDLLGNQYNSGISNFGNALNSGAAFAFNPIGSQNQSDTNQQYDTGSSYVGSQSTSPIASILSALLQALNVAP